MGHFKLKSKIRLDDLTPEQKLDESDFACVTPSGAFIQLEYVDEHKSTAYPVTPGVFTIQQQPNGLELIQTEFVRDEILETFLHTKNITDKIDCFFNKLHIYKKYGIEIPSRKALIYGPAGSGKSSSLNKIARKYGQDKETLVLVWSTDKFDPADVKAFIQSFEYNGVERLILIMEDIGGIEIDQVRMQSKSSLLSLLDNQEKTFKIPHFILSTTNHPEIFLGNLTNRPGRFDDKIEVGFPPAQQRAELLKFYYKGKADDSLYDLILNDKFKEFTPAHIKEAVIRADIYDKELKEVLNDMVKELQEYKNAFEKRNQLGISANPYFDHDD